MKIYQAEVSFVLKEDGPATKLEKPELVCEYMKDAFVNPEQESFWVISLNRYNYPKARQMISLGTATSTLAHPREIFRAACMASATAIICVHNHPSGNPTPSGADITITRQIREAGNILGIPILDHIVMGQLDMDPLCKGYYSFRENGLL